MADRIQIEVRRENSSTEPFVEGKFNEKMTHEQRCFALCLYIQGESWRRIAAYFNSHYRTIQAIKTGPRYRAVRTEFQNLGQDDFRAKYETEAALEAYNEWKKTHDDPEAGRQHTDPEAPGWNPVKRATGQKGQHKRTSVVSGEEVHFDIEWRDSNDAMRPGWYLFDIEGMHGPFGTSTLAFGHSRRLWNPIVQAAAPVADDEEAKAQQLFETAKAARVAMELNPSDDTVKTFVAAAFAVYRFVDASEGLPEPTSEDMFNRIDWRGFDHTKYPEGWNK